MMETQTAGFQASLQLRSRDPASEYSAYRDIPLMMPTAIHTTHLNDLARMSLTCQWKIS